MPVSQAANPKIHEAQASVARVVILARALSISEFDDHSAEAVRATLVPTVTRLLDQAIQKLTELDEASTEIHHELGPLCFVVRGECRDCREALRAVTSSNTSETTRLLVQAERSRHTLTRGLCAVERKLAEVTSTESKTRHIDFVRESRAVRRATTDLRRDLARIGDEDRNLMERVRFAHGCLEALYRHDDFQRLRIYDRNIVRDLHERLDAWLEDPERTPEDGVSALNEVLNFGELLRAVNDRLELVEHDLEVLEDAARELAEIPSGEPPPPAILERLGTLFGRDDVLDELLQEDTSARVLLSRVRYVRRKVALRVGE